MKKEVRGAAGETKAETATRDAAATAAPFGGGSVSAPTGSDAPAKKVYTAEEKRVCSIEAMKNGEECEACQ